jgi:thioredoxin reductase
MSSEFLTSNVFIVGDGPAGLATAVTARQLRKTLA